MFVVGIAPRSEEKRITISAPFELDLMEPGMMQRELDMLWDEAMPQRFRGAHVLKVVYMMMRLQQRCTYWEFSAETNIKNWEAYGVGEEMEKSRRVVAECDLDTIGECDLDTIGEREV